MRLRMGTQSGAERRATRQAERMSEAAALSAEERERLWEHGLHEDKQYHDRLNFFTILETALFGLFGTTVGRGLTAKAFSLTLCAFGILISVAWLILQAQHLRYLRYLADRLRDLLPEFRRTVEGFGKGRSGGFSGTGSLALLFPVLFLVVWIIAVTFRAVS